MDLDRNPGTVRRDGGHNKENVEDNIVQEQLRRNRTDTRALPSLVPGLHRVASHVYHPWMQHNQLTFRRVGRPPSVTTPLESPHET